MCSARVEAALGYRLPDILSGLSRLRASEIGMHDFFARAISEQEERH
jgi:hypothetical protein